MKISGKVSWFGGPLDTTGVKPDENLAFWEQYSQVARPEELFLPAQPPGTTGLARRLNPEKYYIACRWPYDIYPKSELKTGDHLALVYAPKTGKHALARPADWGPNEDTTDRDADISQGLMTYLGIATDDIVEVTYPFGEQQERPMTINRVAISAGHGEHIAGASGYFDEEDETPIVMRKVAEELRRRGVEVIEFWDQKSTNQQDNLEAIVDWHNKQTRDLDVSVHFNASNGQGHGVEVLFVTQEELAGKVSAAIAESGFADRGAKYNGGLYFLNHTDEPAILIETCFCDNEVDAELYQANFEIICASIAAAISGVERPLPIEPPVEPPAQLQVIVALTIPNGVDLNLMINGQPVITEDY